MTNPHGSFIWYELMSPDPEASKVFYGKVIGWTIGEKAEGPVDYRMIAAPDAQVGGVLRIDERMAASGARPVWLGYLGVDNVDVSAARAAELGAGTLVPPSDIPGIGRFALLVDPQGVPFYIMHPTGDGTSAAFDEKAVGHIAWNELTTSDQAGALDFFGQIAGWESRESMPMGEMGDYRFVDHHGRRLGAVMRRMPEGPVGWTFYFRVDEVGAANDRLVDAGGTVLHGPVEVPGGDWIIIAHDPHGAVFGLVGPYENDVE